MVGVHCVISFLDIIAVVIIIFFELLFPLIVFACLQRTEVSLGIGEPIHTALSNADAHDSDGHECCEDKNADEAEHQGGALTVLFQLFLDVEGKANAVVRGVRGVKDNVEVLHEG